MAEKASARVRELADRLEARVTDPRFGGHASPDGAGYSIAMQHAAELARQLASDLEDDDA